MALLAKNSLSDVVGLQNAIVNKVFTCPDCKTDVTISKWQLAGDLHIVCARCNSKYQIKGEELQVFDQPKAYFPEKITDKGIVRQGLGYKVFIKTDALQKATLPPKDSYVHVMKPNLAPKPVAPALAPKPAGAAPVAGAPGVAKVAVAAPAPAAAPVVPKPAEGGAAA